MGTFPYFKTASSSFKIGLFSYPIRIISCYFGAGIVYLFGENNGEHSILAIILMICALIAPHLAFLYYRFSKNQRRAVILSYIIDPILLGVFLATVHLTYIASIVLIITIITSSLALNGPRFTFQNLLILTIVFLISFYIEGRKVNFETNHLFTQLSAIYLSLHSIIFAAASYFFLNNVSKGKNKISEQNSLILAQNNSILRQNVEINERLNYARNIQEVMMPPMKYFRKYFKDFFIYYQPSETVSGDFYWLRRLDNYVFLACADCTGHGVPGAFMSMISYQLIDEIIIDQKITSPKEVFMELHSELNKRLHQSTSENNDGLAISMIRWDTTTNELVIAGSYQPVLVVRDNSITEIKTTRKQIGGNIINPKRKFENFTIQMKEGDILYLFTDGVYDQLGKDGKLTLNRLKEKLAELHQEPFKSQNIGIMNFLEDWKGDYKQTDDITLIGIKI